MITKNGTTNPDEDQPPAADSALPSELTERAQWVTWRYVVRDGKPTKPPFNPRTGQPASVTDPMTWVTYCEANEARGQYDGIGFVLTADDPFVGFDLDHCHDPCTGTIEPRAQHIVNALMSYTEITPSGTGLRVFVRATLPAGGRKRGQIEMYDHGHFLTVTGAHLSGTPMTIEARQDVVKALHARVFGDYAADRGANHLPVDTPFPPPMDASGADDAALLARAVRAPNGRRFALLWGGDTQGYPSPSEADQALCNWLAYYTGGNAVCVDRLFRRSGLYRSKWDERHAADGRTYGQRTIATAIAGHRTVSSHRLRTRCLADVEPQPVTWLWPGRIPRGKLSLLIGDPGAGKSTLALDLVARVSTGGRWPDDEPAPLANAVILSAEDAPDDTIRPRLDRLRGDPARVHVIEAALDGNRERPVNLQEDIAELEEIVKAKGAAIVIIDPLSAYLGKTDSFKDAEVRTLLAPVAAAAARTGAAVIGILHLTKDSQRQAVHRALGSVAFTAAPRAIFAVARDHETEHRRLFVPVKLNLAPHPPALAFALDAGGLVWETEPIPDIDADRALGVPASGEEREERRGAEEFLHELLSTGDVRATDGEQAARASGIALRTLDRARRKVGVRAYSTGFGKSKSWWWALPVKDASDAKDAKSGSVASYEQVGEENSASAETSSKGANSGIVAPHDGALDHAEESLTNEEARRWAAAQQRKRG